MTLKPDSRRALSAVANRQRLIDTARPIMLAEAYGAYDIRRLAREAGLSTGAIFSNWRGKAAFYEAVVGFPPPWRPISVAPKAGQLCLLLVDYRTEPSRAPSEVETDYVWNPRPLEDAEFGRTIGHNNFENDGEDRWLFAGWDWSQDYYFEGSGTPVAFILLDDIAPETTPSEGRHGG